MTNCEEIAEVEIIEAAEAGMRMTMGAKEHMTEAAGRKRKVYGEELNCSSTTSLVELRSRRRRLVLGDEEASSSNEACASCCSSNGSSELDKETSKFLDLEENQFVQRSKSAYELYESCIERRETTPSSEIQAESGKLEESPAGPATSEVNSCRRKMPSDAEIDEFFSAAEKKIQKQYYEKYNFDFEKEQPLEGRYAWIHVKP